MPENRQNSAGSKPHKRRKRKPQVRRTASTRHAAVDIICALQDEQGSLATLLPVALERVEDSERSLLQELTYGTCRWYFALSAALDSYLDKPLRNKDRDVRALLLVGLYQLDHMRVPAHAVINLSVEVATELKKTWAKGLVNAVLRSHQRARSNDEPDQTQRTASKQERFAHPNWMIEQLTTDWPDEWQELLDAANQRPPMVLRINQMRTDVERYSRTLEAAGIEHKRVDGVGSAIELHEPRLVDALPGFTDGLVSVQDASAQLSTQLLKPELHAFNSNSRILDACAAPGGKTCHMLELSSASVCALDISESRLQRVGDNAQRLGLTERLKCVTADAGGGELPALTADGEQYDLALLDAPCSGSGVVRRQPDIKLLRKPQDLAELTALQLKLADSVWSSIKPGGKLLYVTCSVFKQENVAIMRNFLGTHSDAEVLDLEERSGGLLQSGSNPGAQLLTGFNGMDGFYYCLMQKSGDLGRDG